MAAESQTYTWREVIAFQRAAWVAGMRRGFACGREGTWGTDWPGTDHLDAVAAKEYPLPKVVRTRVVGDPLNDRHEWRVFAFGRLQLRTEGGEWSDYPRLANDATPYPTPNRVALWADLFANPTEEVDDDGSVGSSSSQPGEPAP